MSWNLIAGIYKGSAIDVIKVSSVSVTSAQYVNIENTLLIFPKEYTI